MKWIRLFRRKQKTDLIFIKIINNVTLKILAMQVEKGKWAQVTPQLVDHATQTPIEGAYFTSIELASSDEGILKIQDANSDNYADVVGIELGQTTLNYKAYVSYNDAQTGKPEIVPKEGNFIITVIEPAPELQNTDLIVTLSSSQPL